MTVRCRDCCINLLLFVLYFLRQRKYQHELLIKKISRRTFLKLSRLSGLQRSGFAWYLLEAWTESWLFLTEIQDNPLATHKVFLRLLISSFRFAKNWEMKMHNCWILPHLKRGFRIQLHSARENEYIIVEDPQRPKVLFQQRDNVDEKFQLSSLGEVCRNTIILLDGWNTSFLVVVWRNLILCLKRSFVHVQHVIISSERRNFKRQF